MTDYLRTLLLFYRRHLRVQPVRELMAVVGVAAGVALLFAVQVAHSSITGSFEQIAHGVAGRATLEIAARGPQGFDQRISEQIERMPDVKAVAPLLEQPVVAVGPRARRALTLVGATEQIAALDGPISLRFQRAGESAQRGVLVLSEPTARAIGVAPGGSVALRVGERTERVRLDTTIPAARLGAAANSPIAAAPLPVVQSLAGSTGRVSRVLIEPARGHEAALRRALTAHYGASLNVRPIDTEAHLLAGASGPERQVTLLFGAISLVTGMILAYNALLLASDERRRFIAYLIEAGTPDSMIVASLAFDALILGLVGSLLGLVVGDVVSLIAYGSVPGYIAAAFAIGGERVVDFSAVALALLGGMLAAFAAAALPAIVALRPSSASEPQTVGRALSFVRRPHLTDAVVFACGAALIALSVLASLLRPATTVIALIGIAVGLVICLPMVLRRLLAVAYAASRHSSDPAARVSIAELRGSPTRSVALLATGTIAVFLMVLIGGAVGDVQHAVRRGATDLLSGASIWIKPGGAENVYTTEPFSSVQAQRRLQRVDGVSSVLAWRDSFLDIPRRRVWVLGVPPQLTAQIAPSQLAEGSLKTADARIRAGGWVALSRPIARERQLHIGERFSLPTPSGRASVRLAATIANYGWLPGAIVMNGEEHAKLWGSPKATELAVTLRDGSSLEQTRRRVAAALPPGSALAVKTVSERRAEVSAVLGGTLSRLSDTTIVVLVATVASVIALMIAAISQRRARLDSLISIGMSPGQLARLVFYESGAVLLAGCAIGMVAGLLGQYLIDGWLQQTTGSPVEFAPAWQLGLRTIAIAAGISALASTIAVLRSGRFQPRAVFSTE